MSCTVRRKLYVCNIPLFGFATSHVRRLFLDSTLYVLAQILFISYSTTTSLFFRTQACLLRYVLRSVMLSSRGLDNYFRPSIHAAM